MNSIKNITPAALLLLATIALSTQAAIAECLKYEATTIELTGTIKAVTFPGPPNYRSVKEGDKPERYWILYVPKPICVDRDPNNDINRAEKNIQSLQLIIHDYDKYRNLLGQHIIVKGELMHAITGHHHTNVLIKVKESISTEKRLFTANFHRLGRLLSVLYSSWPVWLDSFSI